MFMVEHWPVRITTSKQPAPSGIGGAGGECVAVDSGVYKSFEARLPHRHAQSK